MCKKRVGGTCCSPQIVITSESRKRRSRNKELKLVDT